MLTSDMHVRLVAQLCLTLCNPMDCSSPCSSVLGDPPGKDARVDCHALLQGIFATKKSNPGLPRCRRILYHLSHQGSPRILEWLPCPPAGDLADPGIEHRSPALQADSLPSESRGKLKNTGWIAFCRGSSWPRNRTGSPALQEDSLSAEVPRKPQGNRGPYRSWAVSKSLTIIVKMHNLIKQFCYYITYSKYLGN